MGSERSRGVTFGDLPRGLAFTAAGQVKWSHSRFGDINILNWFYSRVEETSYGRNVFIAKSQRQVWFLVKFNFLETYEKENL